MVLFIWTPPSSCVKIKKTSLIQNEISHPKTLSFRFLRALSIVLLFRARPLLRALRFNRNYRIK